MAVTTKRESDVWMTEVTQAIGRLVVAVTTAQGTVPLPGALVTVSAQTADGPVLYRVVRTDDSGRTPVLELPAPALTESLSPDQPTPYLNYTVNVSQPGYRTAEVRDISIFPGIKSTLPVPLMPLTASGSQIEITDLPPELLDTQFNERGR